ncbi:MAG TPA: cytochrome b/b6 domain-containing protein [Chitinophagaceae bacterium]|nr:cytochrome b/b6 domain-containing protein [Chitinophagaceae bacterium]
MARLFKLTYPSPIRVWHWLTFLLMTVSVLTVLLNGTLLTAPPRDQAAGPGQNPVQAQLPAPGQQPDPAASTPQVLGQSPVPQRGQENKGDRPGFDPSRLDPQTRVFFSLRHSVWDIHKIAGFGLCLLLVFRIVVEVTRNPEDRLLSRINQAVNIPTASRQDRQDRRHFIWVKRGYLIFYALLAVMGLTGLIMAFDEVSFLRPIERPVHQVHSIGQYLVYTYLVAHLVGVIRAELTRHRGMVSAMIHGGSELSS